MDGALVLYVRNDLSELARVADAVEALGTARGLPAQAVLEINLALDEILTNVISYAYDDTQPHEIEVRLALLAGELIVEVEDDGRPFDPLGVASADIAQALDERPIGGLGMHLVRRVTDGLTYERVAHRNRLTLRKRTGAAGERAPERERMMMEISESTQHGVTIVAVSGRLDASNAGELEQKLLGLVESGTTKLVIDCAGLEYISSAGLRVFLMVAKRLGAPQGKLALAAVRRQIHDVLDIAGFSSILAIHATCDLAVASVA